jgi:anti-sigma regulatory factor (Ser/Thr protein kinase)
MERRDDPSVVAELDVPADVAMLAVCRTVLAGVGAGLPIADDTLDDLKLVLSEVCAAAIERSDGGGDSGRILITFRTSQQELEVDVCDRGRTNEIPGASRGLLLPMLRQLCSRLEVSTPVDGEGTVVRFARGLS